MNWCDRLTWRESLCLFHYFLRLGWRRFRCYDFRRDFRSLVAIQTPCRFLVEPLLETRDPAFTLLCVRHGFARLVACQLGFFEVDEYFFRRCGRAPRVRENVQRFGQTSTLRPLDRVQSEIIALFRIRAGLNQLLNYVRVAEDYREDERGLAAAGTFVDVSALGK